MPNERPHPVGTDAHACVPAIIDSDPSEYSDNPDNDEALHDAIDIPWFDRIHERFCRELARQLIQQERSVMTTNSQNRLANIKDLENLQKQYERLLSQESARQKRLNTRDAKNDRAIFLQIEQKLFAQLGSTQGESVHPESES